jgi:predicted metalloenzyme YecM
MLFISGVQSDMSIISSAFADDFVTELATSHQFKLQAVDRAKLLKIRTEKINKRRARLFEQMGIPLQENIIRPKKIFLSKQSRSVKNVTDKGVDETGIHFY